jgi:hypothetical protein
MTTTTTETEELARLALGGRALKNRRIRRVLLARLLNENGDAEGGEETEEAGEEGGGDEREVVRALIASKMLRKRRVRRALLAHLLRTKGESETEGDEGEEESFDEGGTDDQEVLRALIGSRLLRRRRFRRAILVHLLRTKGESEGEGDEGEGDSYDEDGGDESEVVRALIASRLLRRRRVRRALLAHLLRERHEAMA